MQRQPRRHRAGLARRLRRRLRRLVVPCIARYFLMLRPECAQSQARQLHCAPAVQGCCQAALQAALLGGPQPLCNLPQLCVVHFYGVFVCDFHRSCPAPLKQPRPQLKLASCKALARQGKSRLLRRAWPASVQGDTLHAPQDTLV